MVSTSPTTFLMCVCMWEGRKPKNLREEIPNADNRVEKKKQGG